jgi:hypothetical protein
MPIRYLLSPDSINKLLCQTLFGACWSAHSGEHHCSLNGYGNRHCHRINYTNYDRAKFSIGRAPSAQGEVGAWVEIGNFDNGIPPHSRSQHIDQLDVQIPKEDAEIVIS